MASIQKRKESKYLYLVWWQDGKQRWRSTGTDDWALAQRALEELKATLAGEVREERIRDMLEFAGQIKVKSARVPMESAWEVYSQQPMHREVRVGTQKLKKQRLANFVEWMGQRHPEARAVHEVTERLALQYMASLADKAGQTRNNILSDLRSIWDVLRIPLGVGNPWSAVKRVEVRHIPHQAFDFKQVRKIFTLAQQWSAAGKGDGNFWPAAIAIGYHTGLRFGDVCELSWEEVDFPGGRLVIFPNKDRAKRKPVVHPLHKDFAGFLQQRLAMLAAQKMKAEGPVWPAMAARYQKGNQRLYEEMQALFKAAGIQTRRAADRKDGPRTRSVKEYGFHSLRATYATMLTDAGAARSDIQDLLGHATAAMTAHYSQSTKAGERVAELLPALRKR